MHQMIFVNLPVSDLPRSIRFYESLGFTLEPRFTDDQAACIVISDAIFLMLLTHARFDYFSALPRSDPAKSSAALLALSRDSRAAVDTITEAALAHGGTEPKAAIDYGFMYSRTFLDPDGNVFEPMWMDMEQAEKAATAVDYPE
ncbi:VOC family protein [Paragemmobacter straminiformis]|uniref:Lactoylglutathione lyase n=1 Tax=Paragemmobacter straminiformis TaxID=2045119 RepID=A0A842I569_9RHOB|nr:VOC family protein [Gemmobacter straminiformis]MBC2834264.1 lactoylglutathione lyase [Gemmobacter straminiformis]